MVWFLPAALSKVVTILPIAARILKPVLKKAVVLATPVIRKITGKVAAKSTPALLAGTSSVSSTISRATGTKAAKVLTGLYIGGAVSGQSTTRKTAGVLTATAFGGPTAGVGVAISTMFNRKSDDVPANVDIQGTPLMNSVKQSKIKNVIGTGGVSLLTGSALNVSGTGVQLATTEKFKVPDSLSPILDSQDEDIPRKGFKDILSENVRKAQEYADNKISGLTDNPTARDILLAGTAATGGYLLGAMGQDKGKSTTKKKKTSTSFRKKSSSKKKSTKKRSSSTQKGRKLKFGSPAWRAKYLSRGGKKRQGKKGKSVSVASIKRKGIPGPDRVRLGTEAQYKKKGGKKVYHTKTGQPYIKMKSGKARFIKRS